ncbi:hypothetical protein K3G63_09040 [Hymenobacter sp. HSC-4F20]|uniref:Arm DNA-binding domain-containing protein n=1 Tax=Hymenobacter sp. HSC-4F20 TaxID=2864135 RepID=UPI001C73A6BC|nr:hypothetical protein [Hymenobacter sp. HSC-4F20]MBX0290580.1 hypothetical protein [Hymenobacter sp. HSC-4F20]
MIFSANVVRRTPARKDGTCLVRLQVIIRRKIIPVKLGITWFPELFDAQHGQCLAALPKAQRPAGYDQLLTAAQIWAGGTQELLAARAEAYTLIIGQGRPKPTAYSPSTT